MKKILGWLLVLGGLAAGSVYWVFHDQTFGPTTPMPAPSVAPVVQAVADPVEETSSRSQELPAIAPVKTLSELYAALDAIDSAARQKTPESLVLLIAYASTPNPDLSDPALDALIRRGDTAAGPMLRAAAKKLEDPRAAVKLLDTADFIELPPADFTRPTKPSEPSPISLRRRPLPPEPTDDASAAEPNQAPPASTTPAATTN